MSTEMVVQRRPDGSLRAAVTNEKGAARLAVHANNPVRIENYFSSAFGEADRDSREERFRKFMRVFSRTDCLNCSDRGHFSVSIEMPNDATYQYAFACNCKAGIPGTESITTLTQKGVFTLQCEFDGPEGGCCPLKTKDSKCLGFKCPKFDH